MKDSAKAYILNYIKKNPNNNDGVAHLKTIIESSNDSIRYKFELVVDVFN
jgi:hypothetical protein